MANSQTNQNQQSIEYKGLGRRKSSVARVKLVSGHGNIFVNQNKLEDYFCSSFVIKDLKQPLVLTATDNVYDVYVKVSGGGFSGQAGAIRLAIARALLKVNEGYKKPLKLNKLLTSDSRLKERKKYGLYGARRRPQFTKR